MIIKYICTLTLACLTALSAVAQTPLKVSEQNVSRDGQEVIVSFKIIAAEDAVKHGEKILVTQTLTPCNLVGNGEQISRQFYIASHQQKKIMHQKARLDPKSTSSPAVFIGNGETYTHIEKIPYDSSFKPRSYEFKLSAVKIGCCGAEECFSSQSRFEVGPAMAPAFKEVQPKSSGLKNSDYSFLRMTGADADASRGASVRFTLANTQLNPEYSSNSKTLKDIVDAINLILKDDWAGLDAIEITGYASPEGNSDLNQKLSKGRAESLKAYIMERFNFSEEIFNVKAGGEDWPGLRTLVMESDMQYKEEILGIIDNAPQEQRLAKLKTLAGGRPYKSMEDVLFPQLRDACYINIRFSEKEDIVANAVNEAVTEINAGKYESALARLMEYKNDSRTWNAIGSVKVLTEDLKDAQKWFGKAAKTGDSDAAKNLKQIEEIMNNNN